MASEPPDPDVEVPGGGRYGEASRGHSYLGYSKYMMQCIWIIPGFFSTMIIIKPLKFDIILVHFRVRWFKNPGIKHGMIPLLIKWIILDLCYVTFMNKYIEVRIQYKVHINFELFRSLQKLSWKNACLIGAKWRSWETMARF